MISERGPIQYGCDSYPSIHLAAAEDGLQDKAFALTGLREVQALDSTEFVRITHLALDPSASTFLPHTSDPVLEIPEYYGAGVPFMSLYQFAVRLDELNLPLPVKENPEDDDWGILLTQLEGLRSYLADIAMATDSEEGLGEELEAFRQQLGEHTGLFYFLRYLHKQGMDEVRLPAEFKTKYKKKYKANHLVADFGHDEPDTRKFWEKWKSRPPVEIDLGPVESAHVTFVGGKLSTLRMAAEFADNGAHVTLVATNPIEHHALRQFLDMVKAPNVRLAHSNEEVNDALKTSGALFIHDLFDDEPFVYSDYSNNQFAKRDITINIHALVQNASRLMRAGAAVVVTNDIPAFDPRNPIEENDIALPVKPFEEDALLRDLLEKNPPWPENSNQIFVADGKGAIEPLFKEAHLRMNNEVTSMDRQGLAGVFRMAGRTIYTADRQNISQLPYIQFEGQLEPVITRAYENRDGEEQTPQAPQTPQTSEPVAPLPAIVSINEGHVRPKRRKKKA